MINLPDTSLEWALKHLERFSDSDFYPKLFEFSAIRHSWGNIKNELIAIDIEKHTPKSPILSHSPKPKGGFRAVHQLDPIDSILYTALMYECAEFIEAARISKDRKIACSYRIEPDLDGSFFLSDRSRPFIEKSRELAETYKEGYVLICDITDYYNQIYLHRVNNVLDEVGTKLSKGVENFLTALNANISRGIPVGPLPSILIAEAIMSDIDNRILRKTSDFTRYVDDIHIFFSSYQEAFIFLHELSDYLYSSHRLVLSSEKTKIVTCSDYIKSYIDDEERHEKQALHDKLEEFNDDYPSPLEIIDFDELHTDDKFVIRSEAYLTYLKKSLNYGIDLGLIRHILRSASKYRVRSLVPFLLDNFYKLLPAINDVVNYIQSVITAKSAYLHCEKFNKLLTNNYLDIPYINMWVFTLFQHPAVCNTIQNFPYKKIHRYREAALIARSRKDLTWVKEMKSRLDVISPWDKRAVIYASSILSKDERNHWLKLESSKGNLLDKAVCSLILSIP